jgi:hypothetical protein
MYRRPIDGRVLSIEQNSAVETGSRVEPPQMKNL